MARLWLDHGPSFVLAMCDACPAFREPARDAADAWRRLRAHALAVHADHGPTVRRAIKSANAAASGTNSRKV